MYCGGPQGPEPKAGVSVSHGLVLMSKPAGFGWRLRRASIAGTPLEAIVSQEKQIESGMICIRCSSTKIIKMTNTLSVLTFGNSRNIFSLSTTHFTFVTEKITCVT